jgi:hypothetical protein
VHHSDRGTQYRSMRYTERLAEASIAPSVGSRGDSYDNALAESIIGLFKTEVIQLKGPWRHLEAVEFATLRWVDFFNTRRLLEPIGYVPPAEYEARYSEQLRLTLIGQQSVSSLTRRGARRLPRPTMFVPRTGRRAPARLSMTVKKIELTHTNRSPINPVHFNTTGNTTQSRMSEFRVVFFVARSQLRS